MNAVTGKPWISLRKRVIVGVMLAATVAAIYVHFKGATAAELANKKAAMEKDHERAAVVKSTPPLAAAGTVSTPASKPVALRLVEVNTATVSELAQLVGVGEKTASDMVAVRETGRFTGWSDLVRRVAGISAAGNAVQASISGLTVNGKSLQGAPPDPVLAAKARELELNNARGGGAISAR